MDIEIIAVGSEVLSGHTVNTNAAFLSQNLSSLGYVVSRHTTIRDDELEIERACKAAMERVSLVIVTGGLGPTLDDVTKKAVDKLFHKQISLKNTIGIAAGVFYQGTSSVILLPGVPREMEAMFTIEVLPLLQEHFCLRSPCLRIGAHLCLLREVEVNPYLLDMQKQHPDVDIGIYPFQGSLWIEFSGPSKPTLEKMIYALEERFPTFYLGPYSAAQAVHRECIARKKTLALAESCSGGAMAAALTAQPDASLYFLGSFVVYSNAWKERFLEVSRSTLQTSGAVSSEAVEQMIQGLFRETDADFAIAVSGILGPSGGSLQKPVGTVYLAIGERGQKTDIGRLKAPSDRASAIQWTVQTALSALWRRLVHGVFTFS